MKVWELKEDVEYTCETNYKYRIIDNTLQYLDITGEWVIDKMEYNDAIYLNFTEYTPHVDWSKVEVDAKVLVRDDDDEPWIPRHFAKYEDGYVWVYPYGCTSFTTDRITTNFKQTKLYTE